jgi:hypothetical protein
VTSSLRAYRLAGLAFLSTAAFSVLAPAAQAAESVRIRGTIESIDATSLTVKTREGKTVAIKLADGWAVSGVKKAALADIKPGSFVGAAAMGSGDTLQAVEILVFPAGAKSNEGHYGWDLMPESTMTNATVASTIESVKGPVLTLAYPGGEKHINVSPETPIVTFAPAEKSDLKPGAAVFVPVQVADDKSMSTQRVIVGNNGVAPPM